MSGKYKLTYFDARGMAEVIRIVLKAAGQEFEDVRIKRDDWPELKPKTPTGFLPILETPEGKTLSQSLAIARYLAKKYDLYGQCDWDLYLIERTIEQVKDMFTECVKIHHAEESQKKEMTETFTSTKGPLLLKGLVTFLEESETRFFAGAKATLADFFFVSGVDILKKFFPKILDDFPKLTAHYDYILKEVPAVGDWIQNRPKTEM